MKKLFKTLLFGCALVGLSACSADDPWGSNQGEGKINLRLTTSSSLVEATTAQTRAEETLEVPDVSKFSVSLDKNDNSYSKTWSSLDEFAAEDAFPTGIYTITAFYGDVAGEGFDKPYYEGTADVTVLEARTTDVSVEAALANSLVSVGYTDAFKSYFGSWGATVHSEGNGFNEIPQGEKRPVYIVPGNVDISLALTSKDGKETKVQPTSFKAEPRHRYHVVFDVNSGNEGEMQLTVNLDESIEQESVVIDLTDELFTTPGPEVTPTGFVNGQTVEALEGSAIATNFIYNVVCRGQMRSAKLTVKSNYTPSFGNEIDLCASTASVLQEAGLDAKGFVNNPDRLAVLNVSDFVAGLPTGDHEITLVVMDKFSRVSEPVTLVVKNVPTEISAKAYATFYGTNDAVVEVTYNGANPTKYITFTSPDDYGSWKPVKVLNCVEGSRSRAFESKTYQFTLEVNDTQRDEIPVKVFLRGKEKQEVKIPVIMPKYTITTDARAHKVGLKFAADDSRLNSEIVRSVRIFVAGPEEDNVVFTRDAQNGIVWVSELTSNSNYTVQTTLAKGDDAKKTDPVSFKTEEETQINGDFKDTKQTINIEDVQVGGLFRVSPVDYPNKSSIARSEATGWASLNQLTCWKDSKNKNTWFLVPSTFVETEDGVPTATIRTVGYNHDGITPETSGGAGNRKYYCENAPSQSQLQKCAGEMFLGSYSYNGTESRTDGMKFSSRPSSLSFEYTYTPNGDEKANVLIEVLNASGEVIARGERQLGSNGNMKSEIIDLPEYKFGTKAAKLRVSFKSSTAPSPGITIPSGKALDEGIPAGLSHLVNERIINANSYKAFAKGSELKVRNIKLNY